MAFNQRVWVMSSGQGLYKECKNEPFFEVVKCHETCIVNYAVEEKDGENCIFFRERKPCFSVVYLDSLLYNIRRMDQSMLSAIEGCMLAPVPHGEGVSSDETLDSLAKINVVGCNVYYIDPIRLLYSDKYYIKKCSFENLNGREQVTLLCGKKDCLFFGSDRPSTVTDAIVQYYREDNSSREL